MKTAISVPDELFREAEAFAKRHGASRSKLYSDAMAEYLATRRREDITARLNEVYSRESSRLDPALRRAQAKSIGPSDW